jgi:hypothetical protein
MSTTRVCRKLALIAVAIVCSVSFTGCEGDYAVPITSGPTRKSGHSSTRFAADRNQ